MTKEELGIREVAKHERSERDESDDSQESRLSRRLYGILKFDGDPPDDETVKDLVADYLIRKYS